MGPTECQPLLELEGSDCVVALFLERSQPPPMLLKNDMNDDGNPLRVLAFPIVWHEAAEDSLRSSSEHRSKRSGCRLANSWAHGSRNFVIAISPL